MRYSIILLAFFFIGCKPIYRVLTGVRKSKIETEQSVNTWAKKHFDQKDEFEVLVLHPKGFSSFFTIEPFVIDKRGTIIYFNRLDKDSNEYSLSKYLEDKKFTKLLATSFQVTRIGKDRFQKLTEEYYLTIRKLNGQSIEKSDYVNKQTVIIPFAKFFGKKLAKKETLEFIRIVRMKCKDCDIKLLNFDRLESWGEQEKKNTIFGFR